MAVNSSNQTTESPKPLSYLRLPTSMLGLTTLGYGASLLLHVILLGTLAVIAFNQAGQNPIDLIRIAFQTDDAGGGDGASTSGNSAEEESDPAPQPQLADESLEPHSNVLPFIETSHVEVGKIALPDLPIAKKGGPAKATAESAGNGTGGPQGNGGREGEFTGGFEYSIPKNGKAVIQGNFAAWTVPEDPQPNEKYKIVIQIKLPENIKQYALTDISGLVEGSDTYKQTIPQTVRGFLPVIDHQTQMVVEVPGAAALVKDVIVIRSRMLGEKQKLEIVF
jgi:hypothetical protein